MEGYVEEDRKAIAQSPIGTFYVGKRVRPAAVFTATPTVGDAPLEVKFDASASASPDGTITSYTWTFGDGGTGTGAAVSHTYGTAGAFTAELRVGISNGTENTASVRIDASPLYVDASKGNDSTGDGTAGKPVKTISRALRAASGRTVLVAPGLYDSALGESEKLTVPAGARLLGTGASRDEVKIAATLMVGRGALVAGVHVYAPIMVEGGGRVVLENVGVSGSRQSSLNGITFGASNSELVLTDSLVEGWAEAVAVDGSGNRLTVTNCYIKSSLWGVAAIGQGTPVATARVVGNWISGCNAGICVLHGGDAVIESNKLFGNDSAVQVVGTRTNQIVMSWNVVMRNRLGQTLEAATKGDLGGGSLGSKGGNLFIANDRYAVLDLRSPYSGALYALDNTWENPMSGTLTGPAKSYNPAKCYIENEGNSIVFSQ